MENTQCIPCNLTTTICRKRSTWRKFSTPTTRITGRRRSLRSRIYHQTSTTRARIPILYQMERLSRHRSNVGKRISIFRRWKYVTAIQNMSSNLTLSTIYHQINKNMFLRKTKSTPILKTSSTLLDKNERLNRNIDRLQTMIDNMIKEYEYMDQPLKYPRKPESSSQTPTADNSVFINQRNN